MSAQPREIRIRLLVAIGLVTLLASVYVRALATASVYGTFSGMVRPWQRLWPDFLLFGLAAGSLVCLAPLARRDGPLTYRVIAILLASLPLLVLGHFLIWLILDYAQWGG